MASYLSEQINSVGIGTFLIKNQWVAGLHRACPSASLYKNRYSVKVILSNNLDMMQLVDFPNVVLAAS